MKKAEFLEKLRSALSGKVSSGLVTDNMRYYEDYINTEIRKGKSEGEVLAALGDPRLIARTIIETQGGGSGQTADYKEDAPRGDVWDRNGNGGKSGRVLSRVPAWVWLVLSLLIAALLVGTVFSVMAVVIPVLLPILLVLLVVKVFRDWIH